MRRALLISAIAAGAALLAGAALIGYAYFNLSSIVARHRQEILASVSDGLGRPVEVARISAHAGWGVSVKVSGLTVADDPAFSQLPFIAAKQVSVELALLPLLHGKARVSTLDLIKPDIRIVRNARGELDLGTLGSRPAAGGGARRAEGRSPLAGLSIKALSIENGSIHYTDLATHGAPLEVHHLDFNGTNFSTVAPFDVNLKLAFAGDKQNLEISGKMGPLLERGLLDLTGVPLDLKFSLALLLDRLRELALVGPEIPAPLSMPNPVSVTGTLRGSLDDLAFAANTDLAGQHLVYAGAFDKPAGAAMSLSASGKRTTQGLQLTRVNLKLAGLDLTASGISLGAKAPPGARIDTNSFSLAEPGAMVTAMAGYAVSGKGEIHGTVKLARGRPDLDATVTLAQAAVRPAHGWPPISNLNGTIRITHEQAAIDLANFTVGSAHASLQAQVASPTPLSASYALKADSVRLHELFPSRPHGELVNRLVVTGTAGGTIGAPNIDARISSSDGQIANIAYRNLDLAATYGNGRVSARPLNVDVFGGAIALNLNAILGTPRRFSIGLAMRNVNVEQALRSRNIDAANIVHGLLTGSVTASGSGATWDGIKPTLLGNGKLALANGKLIGINLPARVINEVASAPGVSQIMQIVSVAFMSSHRGMLLDPDTELRDARMSFQLAGTRFTTHDLTVRSPDYLITGDGWFDMDKNVDMRGDLMLSLGLSVAIPMIVTGRLPAVLALPNVPVLAERVAMGAITTPGRVIEGMGSLVGGASSRLPQPSSIPNPLNTLKNLLP